MAALEGEVKDLKRTIGGREFDRKVSQSESLKAQKEKERQHLHDQPLLSQRQVRKLTWVLLSVSGRRNLSISRTQTQRFKNGDRS